MAVGFASACLLALPVHAQDLSHRADLSEADRARVGEILKAPEDFSRAEAFEAMSAGAATSKKRINRDSFSHPTANLSFEEQ